MLIASRSQTVSLIVIPFCLSVCLNVCRSFRDLQPTTIDRSQPDLVGRYIPASDPCKPFWIPYLPYFLCQREKYAKFRLFPTANVTHRAIWLVMIMTMMIKFLSKCVYMYMFWRRSLRCLRNAIHSHLIVAFIMKFLLWLIMYSFLSYGVTISPVRFGSFVSFPSHSKTGHSIFSDGLIVGN